MSVFFRRRGETPVLPKLASDYAVGESVFLPVNGVSKEFLVIQQGRPSSSYDTSCDGTWLLMKDIYETRQWHGSNSNSYKASTIHTYLNGDFLALFDTEVQTAIQTVKIPYHNGTGSNGSVASGSNGLSTKIFLLGGYEVGFTTDTSSYLPVDGACLNYFTDTSKRLAYLNGTVQNWWLRSTFTLNASMAWGVDTAGNGTSYSCTSSQGVRPALILPNKTKFNPDTNMIL